MLLTAAALLSGCGAKPADIQTDQYLVGANYYSWYPDNWSRGCLRRLLEPEQQPWLGYYDSWNTNVIEQQIAWCSQYGIDFLTLDWWPGREDQTEHIKEVFLKAKNISDIKFCIFYETWTLNFNSDTGATTFNKEVTDKFIKTTTEIARDFFGHPSYLKIQGRPVIIMYLTRTLAGEFAPAIGKMRKEIKKLGYNPFIIGDEIFWKVTPIVDKGKTPHPLVTEPQMKRLMCFDAITSYNMYESEMRQHEGYGAESSYIKDVTEKYREYLDASGGKVYFMPEIIPGYNDRAGRLLSNHHVISRRWNKDAEEGSFFAESFDRIALDYIDPRLNMILLTSWNEWNEDTAIEPMKPSPDTNKDKGDSGKDYTCDYTFCGYGMKYLEIIRDKVVGVYGQLIDQNGNPVPGTDISLNHESTTLTARTDNKGYYRFSRLGLAPGKYTVSTDGCSPHEVNVMEKNATEINFTVNRKDH